MYVEELAPIALMVSHQYVQTKKEIIIVIIINI